MSVDKDLIEAIKQATSEFGQSPNFANKLIAWVEEMSSRAVHSEDEFQFLRNLRSASVLPKEGDER